MVLRTTITLMEWVNLNGKGITNKEEYFHQNNISFLIYIYIIEFEGTQ